MRSEMKKLVFLLITLLSLNNLYAQMLKDHNVVLDENDRLQPWTGYDNILVWSMNFLKNCPTKASKFGKDPLYLVTSKLYVDGTFCHKQNNQGSNVYWGMETFKRYYAYNGDLDALLPVQRLIERVAYYHTPCDWAWPNVPRTQDDTPDGEYTDEWGGVDKICMVAIGYIEYSNFTGKTEYFARAEEMTKLILEQIKPGDENKSPLPFRVNLKTGEVLDPYCSNMILVIRLFDLISKNELCTLDKEQIAEKRELLWNWIITYPMQNYKWSGYYEDVVSNYDNLNQQNPMETARYILKHPEIDPDYKEHIPALIAWVENRFGQTKRYGATSIREQDGCFQEMSSHTARYASIVAKWFGVCLDEKVREEARATFALATYSAYNKYSENHMSINYTGLEYVEPWFSDSYWDYLPHILDGISELPEMLPKDEDHIFYITTPLVKVSYKPGNVSYEAFEENGMERIKLCFTPQVFADGKPLDKKYWSFGTFRGVDNILIINRSGIKNIEIKSL